MLQSNHASLSRWAEQMESAGRRAVENVAARMRAAAEEYRRRVAAAVPLRSGRLRESWQVAENVTPRAIELTLGTNQTSADGAPYPVFLELGTAHIAGGQVQQWQPGEQPITDGSAALGGADRERPAQVAPEAFSAGQSGQMPFLRPIGSEIADELLAEIPSVVAAGFQALGP